MMRPTEAQIAGAMARYPDGPMATRIGSDATYLYKLEDAVHGAIEHLVIERMTFMTKVESPDRYKHGLPQVLYDLFEHYDEQAVRKAIYAWLADNPETTNEGETK